jgi:hypothetical protein
LELLSHDDTTARRYEKKDANVPRIVYRDRIISGANDVQEAFDNTLQVQFTESSEALAKAFS